MRFCQARGRGFGVSRAHCRGRGPLVRLLPLILPGGLVSVSLLAYAVPPGGRYGR